MCVYIAIFKRVQPFMTVKKEIEACAPIPLID